QEAPSYVCTDSSYKLDDLSWREREYATAHIPGAAYAHLDRDLSAPKNGTNGRHPLPDERTLVATFSRFGITSGLQVVAYDQDNGMYASRLGWMLRYMGDDAVPGLDGGVAGGVWKGARRGSHGGRRRRSAHGGGVRRRAPARDDRRGERGGGPDARGPGARRARAAALPRRDRAAGSRRRPHSRRGESLF